MPEPIWYHLRASRSNPPGLAASDEVHRRIYVAAIEQFEELMEASRRISAASRPLTIFYALAQAGKAIVAAHSNDDPPRSHGLTLTDPLPDLMATQLKEAGRGWYQAVSETVGSSTVETVELGEVWAAIPDLAYTPLPCGRWTRAALVLPQVANVFSYVIGSTARAAVLFDPAPTTLEQARVSLAKYPTAQPASVVHLGESESIATTQLPSGTAIQVSFSLAKDEQPILQDALVERRAPQHRFLGEHWLVPAVAGGVVLTPLMAWWALLFGLSMLARYHPASWVSALDLNSSPLAVPLEDALDQAMTAIPHLVLEALQQRRILLRRA